MLYYQGLAMLSVNVFNQLAIFSTLENKDVSGIISVFLWIMFPSVNAVVNPLLLNYYGYLSETENVKHIHSFSRFVFVFAVCFICSIVDCLFKLNSDNCFWYVGEIRILAFTELVFTSVFTVAAFAGWEYAIGLERKKAK